MNIFLEMLASDRAMNRLYEKMAEKICEGQGLTRVEMDVMGFLANNPELDTAQDVVAWKMLPKSNVSAAVDSLCSRGWLKRYPDTQDRRRIHLKLQDMLECTQVLREIRKMQSKFMATLYKGVSEEEQAQFLNMHLRIGENARAALSGLEKTGRG